MARCARAGAKNQDSLRATLERLIRLEPGERPEALTAFLEDEDAQRASEIAARLTNAARNRTLVPPPELPGVLD